MSGPDLERYQRGSDECDYGAIIDNGWCYSTNLNELLLSYDTAVELCRKSGSELVSNHDAKVSFSLNFCYRVFARTCFLSLHISRKHRWILHQNRATFLLKLSRPPFELRSERRMAATKNLETKKERLSWLEDDNLGGSCITHQTQCLTFRNVPGHTSFGFSFLNYLLLNSLNKRIPLTFEDRFFHFSERTELHEGTLKSLISTFPTKVCFFCCREEEDM